MFITKLHIAIWGILAANVSCANGSVNAVQPLTDKDPEKPVETIYANEFGEIRLTELDDSTMRTAFYNNEKKVFDTLMKIDYHFKLLQNDGYPFLHLRTGGIKMRENRLEIYDFAGPAYMAMYVDIENIYDRPFYKLNDTIVINDLVKHQKGGEQINGMYISADTDLPTDFVSIKGIATKEKYPREYYSTADGPQGMFSDTTKIYYRLVIKPIEVKTPPRQRMTGRTKNIDGRAAFIWDLADSEAYYLDQQQPWNENELDKKITIEGVLIQFEDGRSVVKNWMYVD
ncbi:MAG: hypothetical protein IPO32_04725 [Crocinitomicaceae bacterium]|nr:hypothetical protein [Crocinitomicaceae bacterium]